jgi:hypothetical protein
MELFKRLQTSVNPQQHPVSAKIISTAANPDFWRPLVEMQAGPCWQAGGGMEI